MSTVAQAAEEAGFDSLWVSDGIRPLDRLTIEGSPIYEAYSLLGALATKTRSVRLGALPSGVVGRAPAVLAKIVTGLDVISHGRSILSLFSPSDAANGDRLAEEIQICRAVLDDDLPEFSGRHLQINGAVNRPRPMQWEGVPVVVVVESGDVGWSPARSEGLRIAARYADAVVVDGDLEALSEVADVVKSAPHEQDQHSRSRSIEVIWAGELVPDHHATVDGTPTRPSEVVAQQLRERLWAGADGCIIRLNSVSAPETIAQMGPALSEIVRGMSAKPPSREI
jgi:alkanesulfonate monooxygenase SsuD/methylene tetrahydromethanopterin reductase-like flavin-dependent oxidoreductase (luciferase family)